MPRYTTTGIPPDIAARGLSAFLPHYNRYAAGGAMAYKGSVHGYPGTAGIPVRPTVQGVPPSPDPGDLAQAGTSRSSDAPNAIWPNLYYSQPVGGPANCFYPGAGMPIQRYNPVRPQDTTMIPVPAGDLRSLYQARAANLAGGIDDRRYKALKQVAAFARWPQRRSGNGSNQ